MTDAAPCPSFFIVGQPKSGTTALFELLRQHPRVFMPEMKEPNFFAPDLWPRLDPRSGVRDPRTMDEYLAVFAPAQAGDLVGEASIIYLRSHEAAQRIAAFDADARILAVLREPAGLLRSLHLQLLQTRTETERDFGQALALEGARRQGRKIPKGSARPQLLQYSEQVRYVDQLQRFEAHFGRERMFLRLYDDFQADNEALAREAIDFLGLEQPAALQAEVVNTTMAVVSGAADDTIYKLSTGRGGPAVRVAKRAVKAVSSQRLRRLLLQRAYGTLHKPPPPVDEALLAEVRRRYRPEVERLAEYLDRDVLTAWGYRD